MKPAKQADRNALMRRLGFADKPGGCDAIMRFCDCPVGDNGYGLGIACNGAKYGWFYSQHCVVHRAEWEAIHREGELDEAHH